ncbi:MAG: D-alanyl-D-alanine carboxypeptidase [Myxococcales bacterium]|jgi:hypothetical protein|nr:D-alanyl-D-alanine carboxypeptidase [Myxococcales bacterium]
MRRHTALLSLTLAALPLVPGCATEATAPDDAVTFEGLTEADLEGQAKAALARADRDGTDYEPGEGGADPSTADVEPAAVDPSPIRPASISSAEIERALGAGTWGYVFRVTSNGRSSELVASGNATRSMYGASTFKVPTGFTAFAHGNVAPATLTYMLRTSNNALANFTMCKNGETLGRYQAQCAAREYAPATMRMGDATRETTAWLRREGADLSPSFVMKDGSGLLPQDRTTPADLVEVLMVARSHERYRDFREMLAQPGKPSTLRARFAGFEGRLFAKTGTYPRTGNGVKALAGYVELGGGRTLVFAVLGNGVGPVSPAMGRIEKAVRLVVASSS